MKQFALSATILTGTPTLTDYEYYLADLVDAKLIVDEVHYERGTKKGRVHLHALVTYKGKERPRSKKIFKDGMNVTLLEVYDKQGWLDYIRKDSSDEFAVKASIDEEFIEGIQDYQRQFGCMKYLPQDPFEQDPDEAFCHRPCCMNIVKMCSTL